MSQDKKDPTSVLTDAHTGAARPDFSAEDRAILDAVADHAIERINAVLNSKAVQRTANLT